MKKNETKILNQVYELTAVLEKILLIRNVPEATVRLVFLKYVIDNCIGLESMDDTQLFMRAQRMLSNIESMDGRDVLVPLLEKIDLKYRFSHVLSSRETIEEYDKILFGIGNDVQRKGIERSAYSHIADSLNSMNLEESNVERLGPVLVQYFRSILTDSAERFYASSDSTTREDLSLLVRGLLNINDDDVFCDYTAGTGISTITITEGHDPRIIHCDVNPNYNGLAAMLYIMAGKNKVQIVTEDSLIYDSNHVVGSDDIIGNKVFMDPPFGLKIIKFPEGRKVDSSVIAIFKAANNVLSQNGIAVVTCPGSILTGGLREVKSLKEMLISQGILNAVIALPPMWRRTTIGTNLLVLSRKNVSANEVKFIDASKSFLKKDKSTHRGSETLERAEILKILDAYNNTREVMGLTAVVNYSDIVKNDFNIAPARYVEMDENPDEMPLAQLDKELAELYKELLK